MDRLPIGIHVGGSSGAFLYQIYSMRSCHFAETLQGIPQEFLGSDPLSIETLLAGFHPGEREQVLGEA